MLSYRRIVRSLQQCFRRLLRRPPSAPYPRVVSGVLSSGKRYRFTIKSDPSTWSDYEPSTFTAPVTVERHPDDDATIEHQRPKLFPPVSVQIAALRQRTLELAGLLDGDDELQERDRRLLWWFRRQRDQAD